MRYYFLIFQIALAFCMINQILFLIIILFYVKELITNVEKDLNTTLKEYSRHSRRSFMSASIMITYKRVLSFRLNGFLREWSLITGRGGLQNGRGGHVKFYPYEKGGRKKF